MTLIVLSVAVLLHVQVMRFRFERPTQWLHSEATVHQAFLLLPKQQMWNADQKKKKKNSLPTMYFHCMASHGVWSTSLGPMHTSKKNLKAHRNLHVK